MKIYRMFVGLAMTAILCFGYTSCQPKEPEIAVTPPSPVNPEKPVTPVTPDPPQDSAQIYRYVNQFLFDAMGVYYLWIEEPSVKALYDTWAFTDNPVSKVKSVKYSADKWTQCIKDLKEFTSSVEGVETTYGYDFTLYGYTETTACAVVTYVYRDSPADQAGLKRGDVIVSIDGKTINRSGSSITNVDVVEDLMYSSNCTIKTRAGQTIKMSAVKMYEDPIVHRSILDVDGKKVGYLFYTSFTLKSVQGLIDVCKEFKDAGVTELILDLRYNGGGYVITEEAFASMLAPQAEVSAKSLYQTSVYNTLLTQSWGKGETFFSTDFSVEGQSLSTKDSNIGITKMYAILESGSASASESLLVGLLPYLDITIIGRQSHGKYCTGAILDACQWFEDNKEIYKKNYGDKYSEYKTYADNWGLYCMFARFADKDGNTPCMPAGFVPKYEVSDDPLDGYAIGDVGETMLATAISLIRGEEPTKAPVTKAGNAAMSRMDSQPRRADFGLHIETRPLGGVLK